MSIMSEYDAKPEIKEIVDRYFRQFLNIETLEGMYRQLITLSLTVGKELSERRHLLPERESLNVDPVPYPACQFTQHQLNEAVIYQFSYEGMLPLYSKEKQYMSNVKEYYISSTLEALRDEQLVQFKRAFIYICHFYGDLRVRDLDNRNRSHLLNAIRFSGIIQDDSWKKIDVMESGFFDSSSGNHVKVFVVDMEYQLELIKYVKEKYD